jgi:hypothetical protein
VVCRILDAFTRLVYTRHLATPFSSRLYATAIGVSAPVSLDLVPQIVTNKCDHAFELSQAIIVSLLHAFV